MTTDDVTTESDVTTETIGTDAGDARITWHPAKKARLVLAVSHGAGGGIGARDLVALAQSSRPTA